MNELDKRFVSSIIGALLLMCSSLTVKYLFGSSILADKHMPFIAKWCVQYSGVISVVFAALPVIVTYFGGKRYRTRIIRREYCELRLAGIEPDEAARRALLKYATSETERRVIKEYLAEKQNASDET